MARPAHGHTAGGWQGWAPSGACAGDVWCWWPRPGPALEAGARADQQGEKRGSRGRPPQGPSPGSLLGGRQCGRGSWGSRGLCVCLGTGSPVPPAPRSSCAHALRGRRGPDSVAPAAPDKVTGVTCLSYQLWPWRLRDSRGSPYTVGSSGKCRVCCWLFGHRAFPSESSSSRESTFPWILERAEGR